MIFSLLSMTVTLRFSLSAAFDTTDHETSLSSLHHGFGISDAALSWFRSYLFDSTQVVSVNGNSSSPSVMKFGAPQGIVLGPILLCYTLNHSRTLYTITPCLTIASLMTTSSTNQDTFCSYSIIFHLPSAVSLT